MAKNKNKKGNESKEYYFCTHVNTAGYQFELLLTEKEFDAAVKRAEMNPEDIPQNYIVLQGVKKKCQ
jgi:hypothetical protein